MTKQLRVPSDEWTSISVESQAYTSRIDDLRRVDAQVRFLGVEPLLAPLERLDLRGIHWVIVGGESGGRERPMDADWVRTIRDRCVSVGVPPPFKQWGGVRKKTTGRVLDGRTWDEMPRTARCPKRRAETPRVPPAITSLGPVSWHSWVSQDGHHSRAARRRLRRAQAQRADCARGARGRRDVLGRARRPVGDGQGATARARTGNTPGLQGPPARDAGRRRRRGLRADAGRRPPGRAVGYLIDTNVLSELRKRERQNPHVASWYATTEADELFLSVLVVGEVRRGIESLARRDPATSRALDAWLRVVLGSFADRILPVTTEIAQRWGHLSAPKQVPIIDGLLAATAQVHGLVLVTRNVKDFVGSGTVVLDPFAPPGASLE